MTKNHQRYALISVSDKSNLKDLAQALVESGVELISTGGTLKTLTSLGFKPKAVEEFTNFPEMMDGRVKTLHPKIHGGLLANRTNQEHMATLTSSGIPNIEFVIVNLYPFTKVITKESITLEDAIENIDIGGPAMLRAAAKNHQTLSIVTDQSDYERVIKELKENQETTLETRQYLAVKAFQLTSYYDNQIANYLNQNTDRLSKEEGSDWPFITQSFTLKQNLRYGENNHQEAKFYQESNPSQSTIAGAKQLHGKELSYNNIKDADVAITMLGEYKQPAAIAIKHMNPCGVGLGNTINQAFDRCYQADPVSIFGGILSFNRPVNVELAEQLNEMFIEIIIAPGFDQKALDILSKKKNIRLLEIDLQSNHQKTSEQVSVSGGLLIQTIDQSVELEETENWKVYGEDQLSESDIHTISFLMKTVKYVKSNAIVVGNKDMTLGVGAGQMNRVTAAKLALDQMSNNSNHSTSNIILASDAFIPMRDTIDLASKYNVDLIVQPGGSIRDKEVISACQEHGIRLVLTGKRHFKH